MKKRKKVPLCLRMREDHYLALVARCEKMADEGNEMTVQELLRRAAASLAKPSEPKGSDGSAKPKSNGISQTDPNFWRN